MSQEIDQNKLEKEKNRPEIKGEELDEVSGGRGVDRLDRGANPDEQDRRIRSEDGYVGCN
jgi:hypothetical protein